MAGAEVPAGAAGDRAGDEVLRRRPARCAGRRPGPAARPWPRRTSTRCRACSACPPRAPAARRPSLPSQTTSTACRTASPAGCPPLTTTAPGAEVAQRASGRVLVGAAADGWAEQHLGLAQVRRDHGGVREQASRGSAVSASGSSRRSPLDETITGSTTRWGSRPGGGQRGDRLDDLGGGQHAGLDRGHRQVVEHGGDLGDHERRSVRRARRVRRRCSARSAR